MKNLRKAIIPGLVIIAGITYALASWGATSAQLTLTGTVQQILDITVTPTASATGLDLTGNVTALKVADLVATSNDPAGYAVSILSQNQTGGVCDAANGPCFYSSSAAQNDNLSFQVLRDSVQVSFAGDTGSFVSTNARSVVGGDAYNVQVSYDGTAANLDQGTDYSETLTFNIVVN